MREIIFRGKRVTGPFFVHGFLVVSDGRTHNIVNENGNYWVIAETVGQYTGLTDKNGQRIFEGDILRFTAYEQEYLAPVVFSNGAFWIKCRFHDRIGRIVWEYKPEIIGNIHDDAELLEVDK